MTEIKLPKKLIEVALPLDDINAASEAEKRVKSGHPANIHLWWARRPLATARAILFAQLVNDPGYQRELGFGINKKEAEAKRETLFQIIRDLVKWENTNNEEVLNRARDVIWESWRETCYLNRSHPKAAELFDPEKPPSFHDPFAGGGAIPLEAQRLGLESHASDLNPVAVMINKAMIEIPPKFSGLGPVGPIPTEQNQSRLLDDWSGSSGLAEDVRRYGYWMREEAVKRIGHLYPKIKVTEDMVADRPDLKVNEGKELTVIAWLWARTVKSPSPAYSHVDVPLVSSFVLSKKKGKEVFVHPEVHGDEYRFSIRLGAPPANAKSGTKAARGANFTCLMSGTPINGNHIKAEGRAKRLGARLMAVVAEGKSGRIYLPPSPEYEEVARQAIPLWSPETPIAHDPRALWTPPYGLDKYGDLFTPRQLVALTTFSDLIKEASEKARSDAVGAGMLDDGLGLALEGDGATAYGEAVSVLLSFTLDKMADLGNSLVGWEPVAQCPRHLFGRQAIPMVWDYAEANPFSSSSGSWTTFINGQYKAFERAFGGELVVKVGSASQADASTQNISSRKVISTDPPYYDNIGYADLSDFFYVWQRRTLRNVFPKLFSTMAVPKSEELVATPYRHGTKENAEMFFLEGMTKAMKNLVNECHPAFPVTIYYAFKQSETKGDRTTSTGWVTFLEAVIDAGFAVEGTWPVRTENSSRMIGQGTNALASSIVLVCRKRKTISGQISKREFQRVLRESMPEALETMIGGETGQTPIAPVDLAQASLGPGMAIYSKYEAVLNQDGSRMGVQDALILINRAITEYLSPDSGIFDADTQFCSSWFEQYGWSMSLYGDAELLSKAKGTSVDGVMDAGVLEAGSGKVRLLKWSEYESDWDPSTDSRLPIWEACHQMIRRLNQQGESAAGELLARMPEKGEPIRQLAYHLYTLCERKKWADDARAYNELITAWAAIVSASYEIGHSGTQTELGLDL